MNKKDLVIVDIETTGLSKHRHKIIEIAAVKIKNNKIIDEFQSLINPEIKIPSFITKLTGINNNMIKNEKTITDVLPEFLNFLGDNILIAHNANFDYGFISKNAIEHLDSELINAKLCTRKLANRILPELPSKKLSCLCNYFNITNEDEHRAMADVKVTTEIFFNFQKELKKINITKNEDLINFENLPIKKAQSLLNNYP